MTTTEKPRYFTPIAVRYAETDMQGHVFFGDYYTYFDVALVEYIKAIGYGMTEFWRDGADFFYVESQCQYKSRAVFDDILHVHATVSQIGNTSFKFSFVIVQEDSERLVATGHIVAVAVEKETGKPIPVPQGFREAVARFEVRPFS